MSQLARPKSVLGDAPRYARNQEPQLRLFLEHGFLEHGFLEHGFLEHGFLEHGFLEHGASPLHDNLSELMLRQTVVGRKSWLFARSEGGAKAAASLQH